MMGLTGNVARMATKYTKHFVRKPGRRETTGKIPAYLKEKGGRAWNGPVLSLGGEGEAVTGSCGLGNVLHLQLV
jgi:hypothetical protein